MRARFYRARAAIAALDYVDHVRASSIYRSAPVGQISDQPGFLNAAVAVEIGDSPAAIEILADLLAIEARLGRDRSAEVSGGPRPIDLDLLVLDGVSCDLPGPPALILPHPRLAERAFVLRPLADLLGGDFVVTGTDKSVTDLLAAAGVADQHVELLDPVW